jgi:colanic acid biosynthesis glycosyl transferase WcaI
MKILLYGLNFAPEPVGIGKYSGELVAWLVDQGHEVRVITAPPYFPQWRVGLGLPGSWWGYRRQPWAGAEVWRCPLWVPARPSGLTRLLHLASFAASSLVPLLAQLPWRPEVVITVAPAFFCAPAALLLGRLCGRRTLCWLHIQDFELDAAFELGMLKGRLIRRIAEAWERRTLRGFKVVSSISGAMVERAVAKGVDLRKAVLLPNWVDLQAIHPQSAEQRAVNPYRSELGIPEGALVLLYSGSMNKKQGLELLVAVIRQLADLPQLVWVLAGEGPTKAELAAAVVDLPQVRLLPLQPAERMNDWLNMADVHLLPQKGSAADLVLPSKLLGILASGRPVVVSSPASSELGQLAEQGGIRVEPEDATAFAAALQQLVGDPELRRALGQRARLLAEERFGREAVLGRMEAWLEAGAPLRPVS